MIRMEWPIFALLSAITAALVAIFGKMSLEGVDSIVATSLRAGVMFMFVLSVVIFTNRVSEIKTVNRNAMFYIILSGIAGAMSWIFYFLALKFGKASCIAPIDRLSVVFVIILPALILGERVTMKIAIGASLVTVGVIL